MKIKNYYPGWFADNICDLCCSDDVLCESDCEVYELFENDEIVEKIDIEVNP